jgi:hypothetical protein
VPTAADIAVTRAAMLYDTFADATGQRLVALLHSDFRGHVSGGMPLGVGGTVVKMLFDAVRRRDDAEQLRRRY